MQSVLTAPIRGLWREGIGTDAFLGGVCGGIVVCACGGRVYVIFDIVLRRGGNFA